MAQVTDFREVTLDNFICKRAYHNVEGYVSFEEPLPELDNLVALLGGQNKTKDKIKIMLKNYLSDIGSFGILRRIVFDPLDNRWSYVAGQDYPSELAFIRKLILKNY